ncbi:MAG: hypothetical protein AW12_02221 [Candidatus Accumulibacter sp. BA-94]|uniref:hypothetical protein n=1 Tax=Accumulibacter sp. TaxID=2053492 RepID=UPI00044C68F0|nr:hypothetical protein [Accumulibacter sp.]EXI85743.1 MAG: hypothetical protein AW12_02221 [Candidatus Accumulibacter sp. BA-94]HRD89166.1 hypothetical protein [Accumulibacter sp.]
MASSTTNLDLIAQSQSSKEVTANALFDAGSPATLFGRRASLCSGLNWFYYGGVMMVDGVLTAIANNGAALVLSASTTNYIEATRAGVVSKNTVGFTGGSIPLYTVVTGASSVTSYTDNRAWVTPAYLPSNGSVAVTAADVDLTIPANADKTRCSYVTTTGALTANRNVIVPNSWQAVVFCNNSGAFTTTFKTAAGSGVVVAQGKRAVLVADGTNVVRVTPDT